MQTAMTDRHFMVSKLISGGQTGVDQGALRAAQRLGLACGGWCPPGRACESGTIPNHFPLQETPLDASPSAPNIPRSQRTEWNIRDSDATLVLRPKLLDEPDAGTDWTARCVMRFGKPLLIRDPFIPTAAAEIRRWLRALSIGTLNVAGPSEGRSPGIGEQTFSLLMEVLSETEESKLAPPGRQPRD